MKKFLSLLMASLILIQPALAASSSEVSPLFALPFMAVGFLPVMIYCCMLIFFFLLFIFWVFMLVDIVQRDDKQFGSTSDNQKVMWLLIILLTNYIGAIIYFFMIYRKIKRV